MNKNSTPVSIVAEAAASRQTPRPRRSTIERLRQFARTYSYIPAAGSIGGIMLN